MGWYLKVLVSFADFGGRARRLEFWSFAIIHMFVYVVLMIIDTILGLGNNAGYGVLSGLYWLVTLLPAIAVAVRRLHDTGRSGLWLLIVFIPFLGWIVLLAFYLMGGDSGTNRFGPNPKLEHA